MSDLSQWYKDIPRFTRFWLTATMGISISARFGILPVRYLPLFYELVVYKLELWRPVTALFYYPTSLHFLINCYFLYHYSLRLETNHFRTSPSDYLFLLIFNWICCVISGLIFNLPVLMDPMVLSVLYIWCQLNKELTVSFWFGTRFKAMYFPWIFAAMNIIFLGGGITDLLGILVGHLYFFLKFKYPQDLGGPSLLNTPSFLKSFYPDISGGVHGFGIPPASANANANQGQAAGGNRLFGNAWGTGNVLGR